MSDELEYVPAHTIYSHRKRKQQQKKKNNKERFIQYRCNNNTRPI